MYCRNCGKEIEDEAVVCVNCGCEIKNLNAKSRLAYILLAIFLGTFGVHNFYAGYTGKGVAQLLITLLLGWLFIPLIAVWIWVIVDICTVDTDSKGVKFN